MAQNEFSFLEKNGVLICLCSKNNTADVDHVFDDIETPLKKEQIILKKVNWKEKVENIKEISNELNIGLESIVFVDDSPFECEAVRSQLPQVTVYQVPNNLSDYPYLLGEIKKIFLSGGIDATSENKTQQYKQRAEAEKVKASFETKEEYLNSLELEVKIDKNALVSISRISELSLKSNQFNLTTRRYSEGQIKDLMNSKNSMVYSFFVRDKFGDAGLTGVIIIRKKDKVANVDSFYMSCRVIGRGVESSIWEKIINDLKEEDIEILEAEYIPTLKNQLVKDFYNTLGFIEKDSFSEIKLYEINLKQNNIKKSDWIKLL
jgi:FkbH-like protein